MANENTQVLLRRRDDRRTADPGAVRIGDSSITAKLPTERRRDDPRTADPNTVRIGDSSITAKRPAKK